MYSTTNEMQNKDAGGNIIVVHHRPRRGKQEPKHASKHAPGWTNPEYFPHRSTMPTSAVLMVKHTGKHMFLLFLLRFRFRLRSRNYLLLFSIVDGGCLCFLQ